MPSVEESKRLFIGLMSGTSLNSIDCGIFSFEGAVVTPVATAEYPLPANVRAALLQLCASGDDEIHRMATADRQLGELFANAVNSLLKSSGLSPAAITAIGSHGQTIRHKPHAEVGEPTYTLQIGDPNTIAALTRITTVSDFRRRDMALGGQGAPLAPAFHKYAFHSNQKDRCIVNIGGIANLTWLPQHGAVTGFDTGPGNVLMDSWISQKKALPYDAQGKWASTGKIDESLFAQLLDEPYLKLPPPKSTGRELFNAGWLERHLSWSARRKPEDVMATLVEFTAHCIAEGINSVCDVVNKKVTDTEIYVCGGGAHNTWLMQCLQTQLKKTPISTTESLGIPANWVEAATFAWLALNAVDGIEINLGPITGSSSPVRCGGIYPA